MSTDATRPGGTAAGELIVEVPDVSTAAGRAVTVAVLLRNQTSTDLSLRLWTLGLEPTWRPAAPPSVQLAAGTEMVMDVELTPPAGTTPGRYPWSLAVDVLDAQGRPGERPLVRTAALVVDERPQVSATLVPPEVRAWRAKQVHVLLDNSSSVPATVRLRGNATEGMRVEVPEEPTVVPARSSLHVPIRVAVRHPSLLGNRRRLPWSVRVDSAAAPTDAEGVLSARPLLPNSFARAVALITVVALWAGLAIVAVPRLAQRVSQSKQAAATAAQPAVTPSSSASGGAGAAGGSGGSSGGSSGSGGTSGSGGSAAGAASASNVRFTGTVTSPQPKAVSVSLRPISLVDESADGAIRVGGPAGGGALGKVPSAALASFPFAVSSGTLATATNDQGSWSFSGVPAPGYYLLTFAKPGYQTVRYVMDSSSPAAAQPLKVTLQPGQGKLSGTVTDTSGAAVGGAAITLTDGTVTVTTSTASGGSQAGTFAVDGLSTPGTYLVSATLPGAALASRLVTLGAGGAATVNLQLSRGVQSIVGTVSAQSPQSGLAGLGGATVTATNGTQTRSVTTVSTGPVGSYTLADLPTGTWTVTISAPGYLAQTSRITLDGTKPAATFNTQLLPSTAIVQGTVVSDSSGKGIVGAGLVLTGPAGTFKTTSVSTPPGAFSFTGVPPGSYTITATYFGYSDTSASVTADVNTPQTLTLRMPGSGNVGPPTTSRITGTMLDGFTLAPIACPTSGPAQCVTVSVRNAGSSTDLASVDVLPTASYLLPATGSTGLAPGLYTVVISAPGYEPSTTTVRVGEGQTVTAPQVLLFPYAQITGTIGTRGTPLPANTCVIAAKITSATPSPIDMTGATCTTTTGTATSFGTPPDYTCPAVGPIAGSTGGAQYWCAVVAVDGSYTLSQLPRGSYQVAVIPSDSNYLPISPTTITLGPGQIARYDATLDRYAEVDATVLVPNSNDPSGHAIVAPQGTTVTATSVTTKKTYTATTDLYGVARITGLPAGSYTVATSVNGTDASTQISVSLNNTYSVTLVTLAAPGTLLGRVVAHINGADQAVPNAQVSVTLVYGYDSTGNPLLMSVPVTADSEGCFAVVPPQGAPDNGPALPFAGQTPCTFTTSNTVRAQIVNPTVTVTVAPTTSTTSAKLTGTADGTQRDLVVPELRQTVSVSLATSDGSTPSYAGSSATVIGPLEAGALTANVTSTGVVNILDANAGGAVNSLLPGAYTISVNVPGYAPATATLNVPAAPTVPSALTITIHPMVTLTVAVTYDIPRADGAPPTARVTVTAPSGSSQVQTLTDTGSGTTTFVFPNLAPVDPSGSALAYQVKVEAGGYATSNQSVNLTKLAGGTLSVKLTRLSAVKLTLTNTIGSTTSPLPGATVTAVGTNGEGTFTGVTDSNGVAVLEGTLSANGLDAGSYTVTVTPPSGYQAATITSGGTIATDSLSTTCTVGQVPNGSDRTCTVAASTAPNPVTVTVTVTTTATTGSATAVQGATVTLSTTDSALFNGQSTESLTTDANGQVTFTGIIPTTYGLQISAATFATISTTITLTPGQNANLSYSLSAETNTVYVYVTSLSGSPVTGATVTLTQGKTSISLSPVTGQDGAYFANNVRSNANYTLDVTATGFLDYSQKVSIKGGASVTINVSLHVATQDVVVTLTDASSAVSLAGSSVALEVSSTAGSTGTAQAPLTVTAGKTAGTWTATFSQVPYGTYVAVYQPTSMHYGSGTSSDIAVASNGANLSNPVTASVQVNEYKVTVNTSAPPSNTPTMDLSWTKPDGSALDAGQVVVVPNQIVYYLPNSGKGNVGTWTLGATVTPSTLVAAPVTLTMSSSGPSPSTLTVQAVQPGSADVTVTTGSAKTPASGVTVSASCPGAAAVTGTTDANGAVTLTPLVPGSCTFSVGQAQTTATVTSAQTASVSLDASPTLVVTVAAPNTNGSGTSPVGGVAVAVACPSGSTPVTQTTATTGAGAGTATFTGLTAGSCDVTVQTTAPTPTVLNTATVSVLAGDSGTAADSLTVALPAAVVTLLDASKNPVNNATIDVSCGSGATAYTTSATTNSSGQAFFPGGQLPVGSCTFSDAAKTGAATPKTVTLGTTTLTQVTLQR